MKADQLIHNSKTIIKLVLKIIFYILLFFIPISAIIYFLFNPIYILGLRVLKPRLINSLEEARTYYHILTSIFSIIFGISGLLLGYFYYKSKLDEDKRSSRRTIQKSRMELIFNQLNELNEVIFILFYNCSTNESETKKNKLRINTRKDSILTLIEHLEPLIEFNDRELTDLINLISFLEKWHTLLDNTRIKFDNTKQEEQSNLDKYRLLIDKARLVCLNRIAD